MMTNLGAKNIEQNLQAMSEATNKKFSIFLGMFGLSFFVMRSSGRMFGVELVYALLMLLPYAILSLFLSGYLANALKALSDERVGAKTRISAGSVERAAFCTKWALFTWPFFVSLGLITLLLSITEPITGRAFIHLGSGQNATGYCQFVGNYNDRATFHCTSSDVRGRRSSDDLEKVRVKKQLEVCEDPRYAQFRRSVTAFRFIYRTAAGSETIDVSDKACQHRPLQPDREAD